MSTILIGVDATERSEDAIVFGRRLADAAGAAVIVGCAFPYSDVPSRAANATFRAALAEEARTIAREHRDRLDGIPDERRRIRIVANLSPAHALHDLAHAERAALVVVGSTHTGRSGRVLPGSTGERLLHGTPCAVAVVPKDYRVHAGPIRRVGVAYNATDEARAAVLAAADLARALGAELEVIGVVSADSYGTPALMGGPSTVTLRHDVERHVQESLDAMVAAVPGGVDVKSMRLAGDNAAERLAEHSEQLDLLVCGSRGYGPLRSTLVGGVSGQLIRTAHCPVIVVPRGIEAPLAGLFGDAAATAV